MRTVTRFLKLAVLCGLFASLPGLGDQQSGTATWIAHPDSPGPDLPPAGQSMFDQLFREHTADGREYRIPYPFSDLVSYLKQLVNLENGNEVPVVLIPQGRSLQREAAAPDYFYYPREVVAVSGEPVGSFLAGAPMLKHRMYIAHQPKSGQLEVISYNDEAGRFEFQVVDDYRESSDAQVAYTSRATCMSCHQNAGPIFSRSPWDETNFNPEVAAAIARANPERYPDMLGTLNVDVHKVDTAIYFANYFSTVQQIWSAGCGSGQPLTMQSAQCRATLLNAALQYRFSGGLAFEEENASFQTDVKEMVMENWEQRWPGGLLIPGADIPDRDPFIAAGHDPDLDPLTQREPRAHWKRPDDSFHRGVVQRLADFLTSPDMREIDRELILQSESQRAERLTFKGDCVLADEVHGARPGNLSLSCKGGTQSRRLVLEAELVFEKERLIRTVVPRLDIPGLPLIWDVVMFKSILESSAENWRLSGQPANRETGISSRFSDGNRLAWIEVEFPDAKIAGTVRNTARIELVIVHDYAIIRDAVDTMVADTLTGNSDLLGPAPFRRTAVLSDLFARISN